MFDYSQLAALRAILLEGSFEGAATRLHISPSAVSQRIKALEDQLGTPLIIRASPASATAAGQRLFRHAQEVALLENTLADDLTAHAPDAATQIRIVVNADSLDTWFIPAMAKSTGFLFDITTDDQDFSADWLRRGEVMAAVTARAAPIQGCDCISLGSLCYLATASPAFYDAHFAAGFTPDTAKTAPMLMFNRKDDSQNRWLKKELKQPISPPVHYLPTTRGFIDAACLGLGWGLNPAHLVKDRIAAGALVTLGDNPAYDVPLYWQFNRVTAKALQPLTNAVLQAAQQYLD